MTTKEDQERKPVRYQIIDIDKVMAKEAIAIARERWTRDEDEGVVHVLADKLEDALEAIERGKSCLRAIGVLAEGAARELETIEDHEVSLVDTRAAVTGIRSLVLGRGVTPLDVPR